MGKEKRKSQKREWFRSKVRVSVRSSGGGTVSKYGRQRQIRVYGRLNRVKGVSCVACELIYIVCPFVARTGKCGKATAAMSPCLHCPNLEFRKVVCGWASPFLVPP